MNITRFLGCLQDNCNRAVEDGWLRAEWFDDGRFSRRSLLHSRMMGVLSWTLQSDMDLWLSIQPRPWGGFAPEFVAYSTSAGGRKVCEAIVEYESPNSFLDEGCHVGKDLRHYVELHVRARRRSSEGLETFKPKRWVIITSLPEKGVTVGGGRWKWVAPEWADEFAANPFRCMYKRYARALADHQHGKRLGIEPAQLLFANVRSALKGPGVVVYPVALS